MGNCTRSVSGPAGFDLHIHSALSACAENELSPGLVLELARRQGLAVIAITDHNAIAHAVEACRRAPAVPAVIPGVELTSREEVHLLAYFPTAGRLASFWAGVRRLLPRRENRPDIFGSQVRYNHRDELVGTDGRLRQQALDIGLEALVARVHRSGGLAVPAHVDRRAFGLLAQLGYVDRRSPYDGLEVSRHHWHRARLRLGCRGWGFPLLAGSDSHAPDDIGFFRVADPAGLVRGFDGLERFLTAGRGGRP